MFADLGEDDLKVGRGDVLHHFPSGDEVKLRRLAVGLGDVAGEEVGVRERAQ